MTRLVWTRSRSMRTPGSSERPSARERAARQCGVEEARAIHVHRYAAIMGRVRDVAYRLQWPSHAAVPVVGVLDRDPARERLVVVVFRAEGRLDLAPRHHAPLGGE